MSGASRTAVGGSVALALCSGVVAGCTDPEADDPEASPTAPAGMTAPGTRLELGDKATVRVGEDGAVIELVVAAVEKGEPEDTRDLFEGTPYYVHLEATAVSGPVQDFVVERYVGGWAGDERHGPIANPLSLVPTCVKRFFPRAAAPGTTLDTCVTMIVGPGQDEIDHVAFENGGDYRFVDDTDIEWW